MISLSTTMRNDGLGGWFTGKYVTLKLQARWSCSHHRGAMFNGSLPKSFHSHATITFHWHWSCCLRRRDYDCERATRVGWFLGLQSPFRSPATPGVRFRKTSWAKHQWGDDDLGNWQGFEEFNHENKNNTSASSLSPPSLWSEGPNSASYSWHN